MHDATSKGAINYLNLTRELLQKINQTAMDNEQKIIE
jgi:chromosome partitioning protein